MAAAALFANAPPSAVSPLEAQPFQALVGKWTCAGTFASSGKPVASVIDIRLDAATGALVVHHDDLPPNGFHDMELWGPAKGGGFRATIADSYSGIRWLTSPGWRDGALEWTHSEAGAPVERFSYAFAGPGKFKLEWFLVRDGQPTLGDSLLCLNG